MTLFIARRVARAFVLVVIVASAAMLILHLAPGDQFDVLGSRADDVAFERSRHGLDRPFVVQYADWLSHFLRLDFGHSVRFGRPVADLLVERVGNTIFLGTV